MKLIYRAQIIDRPAPTVPSYRKPAALNWRFHAPGEIYSSPTPVHEYIYPLALNWRFRMAARI